MLLVLNKTNPTPEVVFSVELTIVHAQLQVQLYSSTGSTGPVLLRLWLALFTSHHP